MRERERDRDSERVGKKVRDRTRETQKARES